MKTNAIKKFEKGIKKLLDEQYKKAISENIKRGLANRKRQKDLCTRKFDV